ncbi:hypothetical protein E2N92_09500 [Methanofollis formosanus]|uniref:Uncharacterized protein n=1 Tax=Methanofollis formosanus TaxID=299308 RepID=A0A8G1EGB1_9EURY|nr:hypothetical protein [Methanofollis formosanus]QYZ79648.1 hypothetical protein E2N92_09500 [Methanofollis formosanus]
MIGVIDVTDWQTTVDLRTGRGTVADGPLVRIARKVQADHHYPGDRKPESVSWVTDTALDLCRRSTPGLMVLSYAYPYLTRLFTAPSPTEWQDIVEKTLCAVDRFTEASGMTPVIVGTGDMVPVQERIDLSGLACLTATGGAAPRYAGLYNPSKDDLESLADHPGVRGLIKREDAFKADLFCAGAQRRFPDYLVAARPGYLFRGFGGVPRPLVHLPACNESVPLVSDIGRAEEITGIRGMIEEHLAEGERIALIIVEGVGFADLDRPAYACRNTWRWHTYSPGEGQYAAILAGQHLPEQPYPPGFRYYPEDGEGREYPFAGPYGVMPEDTLGTAYAGRSAAVGSRSTMTHVYAGTDIAIECFARNLYNYGTMAAVRSSKNELWSGIR